MNYYSNNTNDSLISFENSMIILMMGIILMMFLKLERCGERCTEKFDLENDMHSNETHFSMKKKKFDINCCNSKYINDKGCVCSDIEKPIIMKNRGGNNSLYI